MVEDLIIKQEFKNLIPPLSEEEYFNLETSCCTEGIRDAIIAWNGFVIDGHNRYEIAEKNDLSYSIVEKEFESEDDVMLWMIDNQNGRRNLTEYVKGELAQFKKEILARRGKENLKVAAEITNNELYDTPLSTIDKPVIRQHDTRKELAKELGWSTGKVGMFDVVHKKAPEEIKEQLRKGDVSINQVYKEIKKEEKKEQQKQVYQDRLSTPEVLSTYDLIYCDPPWKYDFSNTTSREIENHYPTMDIEDLKEMEVPCNDNCVLYMWATAPKLLEAIDLIYAWGFDYKSHLIWNKEKIGMGYWARGVHELLLVATKGKVSPPEPENRISSLYSESRTKHSSKPTYFYEYLKTAHPYLTKIELFARNKVEGFDNWGNESL